MYKYKQSTQNEIEHMIQQGQLSGHQLTDLQADAIRMNYFTGSDEDREEMVAESLKLIIVDFLNQLLGFGDEEQMQFFDQLDKYTKINFVQHGFPDEYCQKVIQQQFNSRENRQVRFKWETLSRTSLFEERLDADISMLRPGKYYEKPHARRTYLLNRVCEEAGIVITDQSSWDYSQKKVFFCTDIIKVVPIIKMPQLDEMDAINVPYDGLRTICKQLETEVNVQFASFKPTQSISLGKKYDFNAESQPLNDAQNTLLLSRKKPSSTLLNLVRGIHYNWIYFGQITNETKLGSWQRLFGDIAETMSSVTCQMYKSICQVQKPNLEQIYAYIEA